MTRRHAPSVALLAVLILIAGFILAACGGSGSPAAHATTTTYANTDYRFTVSHDATQLSAAVDRDNSGNNQQIRLPGLGSLQGDELILIVEGKRGPPQGGELSVSALRLSRPLTLPSLAAFRREPYMKELVANGFQGATVAPPQSASIGGLPAFRYTFGKKGVMSVVNYTVVHGRFVYNLNLALSPKASTSLASSLEAALQSFHVSR
jgi:hypothetical protein